MKRFKKKNLQKIFNIGSFIFIAIALVVTVILIQQRQNTQQQAEEKAHFNMFSESKKTPPNRPLNLVIAVNSNKNPISSVSVKLTYPTEKLELLGVDTKNSDFPIEGQKILGAGLILIERSTEGAVSAQKYFATIQFRTKEETHINEISILNDSQITSALTNKNIFVGTDIVDSVQIKDRTNETILNRFLASNEALWEWVFQNFLPGLAPTLHR